ncbi:MAG: 50S ribosomal protein L24e [Methanomassiliicoccales archaeon]|jgi:large subunit ribosomal protein L24e|nr:50S ribosomal protein L24e [Methanomassiliicoccales archaeon]
MVERKVCSFCGNEIEPGTGRMYVKKDGSVYSFCTHKCYKNMIHLRRVPRRTLWTRQARGDGRAISKEAPVAPEEAKAEESDAGAPKQEETAEKPAKKAKKAKKARKVAPPEEKGSEG